MPESDVASTLSELERKLKELEDELHAPSAMPPARPDGAPLGAAWRASNAPSPPLAPRGEAWPTPAAPPPVPPAAPPAPRAVTLPAPTMQSTTPSAPDTQTQLRELVHFRTELERSAQQLMTEYERVLGSLRATTGDSAPSPFFDPAPAPPSLTPATVADAPSPPTGLPPHMPSPPPGTLPPAEFQASPPASAPAPWQPAPTSVPDVLDESIMDGAITVDAGPFTDITVLSGFEQALGSVPGVREVYVRGFEGSRAQIDVTLGQPVALGTELRRFAPVGFSIIAADAGRLSVAIQGA